MRLASVLLAAICLATTGFAADKKAVPVKVAVRTDRADALYSCGQQATFLITVTDQGKPVTEGSVTVVLTRDGGEVLGKRAIVLAAEKEARVTANLDRPGFVRVEATFYRGKTRHVGLAGAGFDPEKIKATTIDPKDFDAFWNTARDQIGRFPLDVRLDKLEKQSSGTVDSYAISFGNIDGTRSYGFLAVPRVQKGPFPAYVTVPGAGPGPFGPATGWAGKGCLALQMGVHRYDVGSLGKQGIKDAYKRLNEKGTYSHHGKPNPRAFYFYRSILGIDRAINWLAARPDWDGVHMVIDGSSQGGAFALIMAGLNRHITGAAANVPALGEHAAFLDGRQPGWPNLTRGLEGDARDKVLAMSAYYDTVNFARRITCPVIISAGFIDRTCPPGTVYAAYNQIKTQKRMFNGPLAGHQWNVGDYRAFQAKWIAGRLGVGTACDPGD